MAGNAPDAASLEGAAALLAAANRRLDAGDIDGACRLVEGAQGVLWHTMTRRTFAPPAERAAVIFKLPAAEKPAESPPPSSPTRGAAT